MIGLVRKYAVPIIFAPPPGTAGEINSASGSLLKLDSGYFVLTAHHVLDSYRKRLQTGEKLNWQVGNLPPFDPLSRIGWEDAERDTLLLSLSAHEARQVGSCIIADPVRWPAPTPAVGQLVLVAGFLKVLREVHAAGVISTDGLAAMFRIASVGDGYSYCKYEGEEDLVSFNGLPLPEEGMFMGGLSGGPALLVVGKSIIYPVLVGVISQCVEGFGLLRIATLENAIVRMS
jgi:hypothetical protein